MRPWALAGNRWQGGVGGGPGRFRLRYSSVNNTLGALIFWERVGTWGPEGTKALGIRQRTGMCSGTGKGQAQGLAGTWGVLGLVRLGPDSPEGFGSGRHSLWAGSVLNRSGFPSAHPEALKAGTCTAAAGSGPASSAPPPAPVPSVASLPVLQ